MKILAMSDLHDQFSRFHVASLPRPDEVSLVIVAGDLTNWGMKKPEEVERARAFLNRLSFVYARVVYILGNHDLGSPPGAFNEDLGFMDGGRPQLTMELTDTPQAIEEIGGLRVVGINLSPCFDAPELKAAWTNMTDDPAIDAAAFEALPAAEIVVSHAPPLTWLDSTGGSRYSGFGGTGSEGSRRPRWVRNIGSPGLLTYIERHKPRLVICGHVHEAAGEAIFEHEDGSETAIYNVARTWRLIEIDAAGRVLPEPERKQP